MPKNKIIAYVYRHRILLDGFMDATERSSLNIEWITWKGNHTLPKLRGEFR